MTIFQYAKQPVIELANATKRGLLTPEDYVKLSKMRAGAGKFYGVRAFHTANIAIPHATFTLIPFDTNLQGPTVDDGGVIHSTVTNNDRFIASKTGWWQLIVGFMFAPNLTGVRGIVIGHSSMGATIAYDQRQACQGGNNTPMVVSTVAYYNAGNYATASAYQDSGVAVNILGNLAYYSPFASWQFVGTNA